MLFLLIISSLCADPLPAINPTVFHGYIAPGTRSLPTCPEGFNFDTFIFNCTEAVNGYTTDPASCFIINETDFQSTSCLQDEHPDYTLVNNVWVITTSIVDEILCQSVHLSFQPRCNSLMALYRQAQTIVTPSTMVFQDTIQFLANLHAVSDYNQPINPIVTDFITTSFIMNYNYWPSNLPFYTYPSGRSLTISNIIDEQYITSQFQFAQITQFYLARYTWDGTFIGFSPLTTQLNRCGEKNDIEQMWRRFGTNYNSECFFDLLKGIDDEVNEFYELDEESLNRFFRGTKPSTIYDMIVGGSCSLNDLYFAEDNDSYCIETFDSAYDGISPHEIAEIIFDDELYEGIFDGYFNDKLSNFDEMLEDALIVEEI